MRRFCVLRLSPFEPRPAPMEALWKPARGARGARSSHGAALAFSRRLAVDLPSFEPIPASLEPVPSGRSGYLVP